MVEPACWIRTTRLWVEIGTRTAVGLCTLGLAGCGIVPTSRMDECHRLSQTLQADNTRLKDQTVTLRSQNQDLNQRAVDDGRKLRLQEEEIQRMVQSISAYQQEREQLATAFERIKSQLRTSATPVTSGLLPGLDVLARSHTGWKFDPERGVLTIPATQLFEAGSDRLRPEAEVWLRETAALWNTPEAHDLNMLIVGRNESSAVRPAGLSAAQATSRPLGRDRAARIRDVLVGDAGIAATRVEVSGFEMPPSGGGSPDETSLARNRRIEIHLRPHDAMPQPEPEPQPAAAVARQSDP